MLGASIGRFAASAMVNYYLQFLLLHPERLLVGIDQQFEDAVGKAVDLALVRPAGTPGGPLLLSASDPAESPHYGRRARAHSQRGFDERQNRAHPKL